MFIYGVLSSTKIIHFESQKSKLGGHNQSKYHDIHLIPHCHDVSSQNKWIHHNDVISDQFWSRLNHGSLKNKHPNVSSNQIAILYAWSSLWQAFILDSWNHNQGWHHSYKNCQREQECFTRLALNSHRAFLCSYLFIE